MKKIVVLMVGTLVIIWGLTATSFSQMGSEHYRMTTSVISGGGGSLSSPNYDSNATLGQSSPIMDPLDPPYSANYDLYPGFWYTLGASIDLCDGIGTFAGAFGSITGESHFSFACDLDGDGDVDGSDLAGF